LEKNARAFSLWIHVVALICAHAGGGGGGLQQTMH